MQLNYETALGTTALESKVIINGKKHSRNKVSYNRLGFPTQADHNSRRSKYSHVFFNLFNFLAVENSREPLFLIIWNI